MKARHPAGAQGIHRQGHDQTVFRSGAEHRGGSSEIAQCGVELIGAAGGKADLEMVALAVDALRGRCSRGA